MNDTKTKLIRLIDRLSENQIEYIYHLIKKLFGHATD